MRQPAAPIAWLAMHVRARPSQVQIVPVEAGSTKKKQRPAQAWEFVPDYLIGYSCYLTKKYYMQDEAARLVPTTAESTL
jgi:rubredoxin